jgi:hypothetical protein
MLLRAVPRPPCGSMAARARPPTLGGRPLNSALDTMSPAPPLSAKGLGWRIYLGVLVVVASLAIVFGAKNPSDISMTLFNSVAVIGLWGYVYDLPMGWREFWMIYFPLSVISPAYGVWEFAMGPGAPWPLTLWLAAFVLMLLNVPLWIGLWRYAFRSPAIWSPGAGV